MKLFLAIAALAAVLLAGPVSGTAEAGPVRTGHVEAELHSSRAAIAPGERFTIVLRQTIDEHWHSYWINPGDAGEAAFLEWRLPAGASAGDIQWPIPDAIPFADLVNYGYSNEVLLPIEITAPRSLRPGEQFAISTDASWVVCENECVFEEGTLALTVPVEAVGRDDPQWAPRIADALARLPVRDPRIEARISEGAPAVLSIALGEARNIRNARFFPFSRDVIEPSASQSPRVGLSGVSFRLTAGVDDNLGEAPLEGLVAFEILEGSDWVRRGYIVTAQPGAPLDNTDDYPASFSNDYALAALDGGIRPSPEPADLGALGLVATLGLAFVGGLILNIMPCVLPVLSIKALSFAGGVQAGEARRHGVLYFIGVLATFVALALALIALRGAGAAVGWGFQLQEPWVTSGLALLFFVIGLNLLGVFEFGGSLQNAGAGLAGRGGDAGAFFTGALAVVAATPCTAPFMAGALGVALTQPMAITLLIFAALAIGFAAPLTLLHFAPGLQHLIPKPGPWMERAKNVLAFPMFGAAVWLAWVLAEQAGPEGVLALLAIAAALAFVLFVWRWGRVWGAVGALVLVAAALMFWRPLAGVEAHASVAEEPWSAARVGELQSEGRAVFVNFTAAWCITCKLNENAAISRPRVRDAMVAGEVAYLVGDWTNRDADIAAMLQAYGREGVPLYLYYPAGGGEPRVLPQLLSEDLLLETIAGEAE